MQVKGLECATFDTYQTYLKLIVFFPLGPSLS
jgi:hypothetical protein